MDCRSYVTESDIPFHLQGPLIPTIVETIGVDTIRLLHHKYTMVTMFAGAFDELVVMQSIKENVAGLGPLNCMTGLWESPPTLQSSPGMPETQEIPDSDPQTAALLGRCAEALETAAKVMQDSQKNVMELDDSTLVYDGRRFAQIHPRPVSRSRLRAFLLSWLW